MQGLKLQQITLFVVPLLRWRWRSSFGSTRCAGVLLALATIKPQLSCCYVWLTIWTVADWRRRYRWAASFLVSMPFFGQRRSVSATLGPRFWQAVREYHSYTERCRDGRTVGFP